MNRRDFLKATEPEPDLWVVTEDDVNLPGRRVDDHKYTAGYVAVLAGSKAYPGAAWLASQAAYRTGAGYVRLLMPAGAAEAMIDARQGDGRFGASQYVANASPGYWDPIPPSPLPPPTPSPAPDPTPWAGGVKPFLMQSSSQFRSAGPLALTSAAYAADVNEVNAPGGATSATRTTTQTYIAKWWQSNPVASWNDVAPAFT